jgi:hypothetical protein
MCRIFPRFHHRGIDFSGIQAYGLLIQRQLHTILTANTDREHLVVAHAPLHRHIREGGDPDEETPAEEEAS